jgi:aspartyl protease family protein
MPRLITSDLVSLAYTVGLLIVTAGFLLTLYRIFMQTISALVLWALFGLTLVACYSYRFELRDLGNRVFVEMASANANPDGATAAVVRTSEGDFAVIAKINGASVTMALDTRASLVILTQTDAKAAGLPVELLSYTVDIETGNRRTGAAAVTLQQMAIGSIVERSVDALVAPPGQLRSSLLGMSFLNRLQHWELTGDKLLLRDNL